MKSMTAYGRAVIDTPLGKWTIEISSVNRKSAEIQIYLSRQLLKEEFALRKWLSPYVQRGHVTVRANLQRPPEALVEASLPRLRKTKKAWDQIALELGYPPGQAIDIRFLLDQLAESQAEAPPELEEGLKAAFEKAVQEWLTMRETEGFVLRQDMESHLAILEEKLKRVEELLPNAIEEMRNRLRQKLAEVSRDTATNEERIMREVVLMAEKWDVNEEITRIKSHISQFRFSMGEEKKGAVGKTLDFLAQELHREVNTLGAKTNDLEVIRIVLEMKSEVEKIREQVQNVE
jgi:uncharacterized protein (TIGR00255 family)